MFLVAELNMLNVGKIEEGFVLDHIKAGKRQPRRKKMILRAGKRVRDSPAPVVRNSTEYQATQL